MTRTEACSSFVADLEVAQDPAEAPGVKHIRLIAVEHAGPLVGRLARLGADGGYDGDTDGPCDVVAAAQTPVPPPLRHRNDAADHQAADQPVEAMNRLGHERWRRNRGGAKDLARSRPLLLAFIAAIWALSLSIVVPSPASLVCNAARSCESRWPAAVAAPSDLIWAWRFWIWGCSAFSSLDRTATSCCSPVTPVRSAPALPSSAAVVDVVLCDGVGERHRVSRLGRRGLDGEDVSGDR